jgi:integrase/recombinase XerD
MIKPKDITFSLKSGSIADLATMIEYECFCGRADGRSDKTTELVVLSLCKLNEYLAQNNYPTDIDKIGPMEIRKFKLYLKQCKRFSSHPFAKPQEDGLSPHTRYAYLRSIRAAFNRWVAEGFIDKIIGTLFHEQLKMIFNAIDKSTPEGFRDYVLFLTYLDTAARLNELTNSKMDALDLKGGSMKITGKGGKQRCVPIGRKVQKLLWRYIKLYRLDPLLPAYDYLFLTRDGRRLTNNRVEARLKKYGIKAGISGVRVSPHTLRHTSCLLWVRDEGDLFSLQKLTGHSSLHVLRGYVDLANSDITNAHRRHSPVDNMDI